MVVDIDKIGTGGGTDYGPEISALSAGLDGKRDLSALQYTGIDLEDANPWPSLQHRGIRTFVVSLPDYPGVSGEISLSANAAYVGVVTRYWGNPNLTGDNMYMASIWTGSIDGQRIY